MPNLFNLNIAKIVNDSIAAAGGVLDVTLTVKTAGTRTPGNPSGGTNPTTSSSSCKGFIEEYDEAEVDGTLVVKGDRMVIILGDSLPSGVVPKPKDLVAIESFTGLEVVRVKRDPAAATYTCQVRG